MRRRGSPAVLALAVSGLIAASLGRAADGQSLLYMKEGLEPFDELGYSMARIGDADGDGIGDLVVGADESSPGGALDAGSAFILSGADLSFYRRFNGEAANDFLGWSVDGCGDLDGDGFPDVVAGAPAGSPNGVFQAGYAAVFSTLAGVRLHRFDGEAVNDQFGTSVAPAGDLDGDGISDILVGAPLANPGGRDNAGAVYLFSGADGAFIRRIDGVAAKNQFGFAVASISDLDGDRVRDILVGAPNHDGPPGSNSGAVHVISGATGGPIFDVFGPMAQATFGTAVAAVSDVDGDLHGDFIVGAPTTNQEMWEKGGSITVLSGFDGHVIHYFDGQGAGHRLGSAVSGLGDVDGDGVRDYAAGASNANFNDLLNSGSAYIFSAATGTFLFRHDGTRVGIRLGRSIASPDDVNLDGYADVAIGAEEWSRGTDRGLGSVWMHSGQPVEISLRRGNVDLASGSIQNVLAVNGEFGAEPLREVFYDPDAPFRVDLFLPLSRTGLRARFALWCWGGVPVETTRAPLRLGGRHVGDLTFPYPGDPRMRPTVATWNNLGAEAVLGVPSRPSVPCPDFVLDIPNGIRRRFTGTLQGVIYDTGSRHGRLATTNAVVIRATP